MAHQRVDVHQAEARRTVTEQQHHLRRRSHHPRRDRVAEPVTQAAVGPGVEPTARFEHLDELAGVRREIAAVADHHGVAFESLAQLAIDTARLDGVAVGLHQRHLARRRRRLGIAQLGDPVGVIDPVARVVGQTTQHQPEVADDGEHVDMARPLRLGVDSVGDRGRAERSEPQSEVERCTEHHHHVGALLEQASGAQEGEVVVGREQPATHPIEKARHAEVGGSRGEFFPRTIPVHVGADQERRTLGTSDQRGQRGHCIVVGRNTESVARADIGNVASGRPEHVEWEVEERRPPVRLDREAGRFVHHRTRLLGVGDRGCHLGDRRHDRYVVEFLQRARTPATLRRPPAEHHDGRTVEVRRRDRGHPVGDPRTGRQRSEAGPAGELRVCLRCKRCRLFVAGVDHPHALVTRRVVQRPDVTTVEREHHVGAERSDRRHRLLTCMPRDLCHATRP